jgi:hypothetical protein
MIWTENLLYQCYWAPYLHGMLISYTKNDCKGGEYLFVIRVFLLLQQLCFIIDTSSLLLPITLRVDFLRISKFSRNQIALIANWFGEQKINPMKFYLFTHRTYSHILSFSLPCNNNLFSYFAKTRSLDFRIVLTLNFSL